MQSIDKNEIRKNEGDHIAIDTDNAIKKVYEMNGKRKFREEK